MNRRFHAFFLQSTLGQAIRHGATVLNETRIPAFFYTGKANSLMKLLVFLVFHVPQSGRADKISERLASFNKDKIWVDGRVWPQGGASQEGSGSPCNSDLLHDTHRKERGIRSAFFLYPNPPKQKERKAFTSALTGKQKNFNIFSFLVIRPVSNLAEDSLAGGKDGGRRTARSV